MGSRTRISVKEINVAFKTLESVERFFDIYTPISDYTYFELVDHNLGGFEIIFPQDSVDTGYAEQKNFEFFEEDLPICTPPFIEIFVHSNRKVNVCRLDWDMAFTYGYVKDKSMKELWNSEEFRSIKKNCNMLELDVFINIIKNVVAMLEI